MARLAVAESAASLPDDHPAEFTADEFFAAIEAGVFAADRRVVLWDGGIFEKRARTVADAATSVLIHRALSATIPAGWLLWPENPIRLDTRHAPMPDVPVVRGPVERYTTRDRHPEAADVGLLVEIAVSSLPRDLGERAEKYARALVPTYWVADVLGRQVVEHRSPEMLEGVGRYDRVRAYGLEDEVGLILDRRDVARIPVKSLFP